MCVCLRLKIAQLMWTICTLCTCPTSVQSVCMHHAQISNFHWQNYHQWQLHECQSRTPTLRMVFKSKLYFQANTTILFISTGLSFIFLVVLFCKRRCYSKHEQKRRVKKIDVKKLVCAHALVRPYKCMHINEQHNGCCLKWESAWENKTRGMLYELISSSSSFLVCSLWICFFYPHHWVPV